MNKCVLCWSMCWELDISALLTLMAVFDSVSTSAKPKECFINLGNARAFEKSNISLRSPILISVLFQPRDGKLCHGFVPRSSISGVCVLQGSTVHFLQYLPDLQSPAVLIFCAGRIERTQLPLLIQIFVFRAEFPSLALLVPSLSSAGSRAQCSALLVTFLFSMTRDFGDRT